MALMKVIVTGMMGSKNIDTLATLGSTTITKRWVVWTLGNGIVKMESRDFPIVNPSFLKETFNVMINALRASRAAIVANLMSLS